MIVFMMRDIGITYIIMHKLQNVIIHIISYHVTKYHFLSLCISYNKCYIMDVCIECNECFGSRYTQFRLIVPLQLNSCC